MQYCFFPCTVRCITVILFVMKKFIIVLYFLFSVQSAYPVSLCERLFYGNWFIQDLQGRFTSRSLRNLLKKDSSPEIQMQILNSMRIPHRYDIPILKEILEMNPTPEVQSELTRTTRLLFEYFVKDLSKEDRKNIFNIWNKLSEMNLSFKLQIELAQIVKTAFELTNNSDKSSLSREEKDIVFSIVNRLLEKNPSTEVKILIVNLAELILKKRSSFSESKQIILNIRNILNKLLKMHPSNKVEEQINQHIVQDLLPRTIQPALNENQSQPLPLQSQPLHPKTQPLFPRKRFG